MSNDNELDVLRGGHLAAVSASMRTVRKLSGLTRREVGKRMPGRWPRKYIRGVGKGTKPFSTGFVHYYVTVCAEEIRDRAIARKAQEAEA